MPYTNLSNLNTKQCGDRFIPRRARLDIQYAHYKLTEPALKKSEPPIDILSQIPEYCHKETYLKLLWSTIYFNETRVLSFSDSKSKGKTTSDHVKFLSWPVCPRKKPLIGKPEIILDLPYFNSDMCMNLMDWGHSGYLSTIFGSSIYLWSKTDKKDEIINTYIPAKHALRWNHEGTLLAVGGRNSVISIWALPIRKKVTETTCPCFRNCSTTVLCWVKNEKCLLSGCSEGFIVLWTDNFVCLKLKLAHDGLVIALQLSAANRYLCSTGMDCRVRIWTFPHLNEHFQITYINPVRAIAFHPWQDQLLAVGGSDITLWNVKIPRQMEYTSLETLCLVDCLTWNPITGEMVASHHVVGEDGQLNITKILILASTKKVVDTIIKHSGRVIYMLWSSDFTQLATGGSDESLCIWNFFGNNAEYYTRRPNQYKINKKRGNMFQLGNCIR